MLINKKWLREEIFAAIFVLQVIWAKAMAYRKSTETILEIPISCIVTP